LAEALAGIIALIITLFLFGFPVLALGYYFGFEFVAISWVALTMGRKLGVILSGCTFFRGHAFVGGVLLSIYGCLIAIGVSELIVAFHPTVWVKWIFGYVAGAFVAQPNYALTTRLTDDLRWLERRQLADGASLISYLATLLLVPQLG
jgi:hypothetical protein